MPKAANAIFLSASVPDAREPEYLRSADTVAITSAVMDLLHVTLGRRRLVWGGHPAITPMVWEAARNLEVDYSNWVTLYQSLYFKDLFPEDNQRFRNVTFTAALPTREESLLLMRKTMFSENTFGSAVFIGGMSGVLDELNLLLQISPSTKIIPLGATGGVALTIAINSLADKDQIQELDFVPFLHDALGIAFNEPRAKGR